MNKNVIPSITFYPYSQANCRNHVVNRDVHGTVLASQLASQMNPFFCMLLIFLEG